MPKDTHNWQPVPAKPYYACACGVSGKQIGQAWPPIRDPKFIGPEFSTCEGTQRGLVLATLAKYGVKAEDLES